MFKRLRFLLVVFLSRLLRCLLRWLTLLDVPAGEADDSGRSEYEYKPVVVAAGVNVQGTEHAETTSLKVVDGVAFNARVEPLAIAFAVRFVRDRGGSVDFSELRREIACRFDVSTETAKRYIVKHSASVGEFELKGAVVCLR